MKKFISAFMAITTLLSVSVSLTACKTTIEVPETTTEETTVIEETTVDTLVAGVNSLTGEYVYSYAAGSEVTCCVFL